MTMNIYIKPSTEEKLRRYDGSMSGLVNRLLDEFFEGNPSAATGVRREVDKRDEVAPPANPLLNVKGYASKRDVEKIKSGESVELSDVPTKSKNIQLATPTTTENKLKRMAEDHLKYCKAGHLLPQGRSRCTQKSCKYA